MTTRGSKVTCARCGEAVTGKFCVGCGAVAGDVSCAGCSAAIPAGARFCPECGAASGASTTPTAQGRRWDRLPSIVGGVALVALAAFVAGVATGRRSAPESGVADQIATIPSSAGTAPDISSMSPEERASRLFNRVMLYSEQGKMDSARFFAPMAIQSYEMIGPVDAHARYDIGVISAVVGDVSRARGEADTILAARPNHLLGLVLAIRAAELAKNATAAADLRRRLVAAAPTERTALKEYSEHARDIDDALSKSTMASR